MAGAKIIVMYPRPTDVAAFERLYVEEHVPLARAKLAGATGAAFTRVVGALGGDAPWHRVVEIHFPSMAALQASLADPGTQEVAAHAVAISSGGPPSFLVAEVDAPGGWDGTL